TNGTYVNGQFMPVKGKSAASVVTINGVHLNGRGYAIAATEIAKQLQLQSWPPHDRTTPAMRQRPLVPGGMNPQDGFADQKIRSEMRLQPLREAIKHKNLQFWYFYRPMNSEYVYAGGSRFQDKMGPVQHPMNAELDEFYALAEKEDSVIDQLKREVPQ